MPKVGGKHYAYTATGKKAAAAAKKRLGNKPAKSRGGQKRKG
jgi:hypothetical protein